MGVSLPITPGAVGRSGWMAVGIALVFLGVGALVCGWVLLGFKVVFRTVYSMSTAFVRDSRIL